MRANSGAPPRIVRKASANVAELLQAPLSQCPRAAALVECVNGRDRETTFAALDDHARRIATFLLELGVVPGDRILFFEPPSRALYASLIATFRLGAVAMFVELSAGRRLLDAACEMAPPKAFVATPRAHLLRLSSSRLRQVPVKVTTGSWGLGALPLSRAATRHPHDAIESVGADAPALLTFTSGSTGQPKGAVRSHGVLRAQLGALRRAFAAGPSDRELVSLPIVVLINLASGAETVLPDADLRKPGAVDAAAIMRQLDRNEVTRITVSPAFLERLCDNGTRMPHLRTIVTGGGPVFPDIVARARRAAPSARVLSVYGSTEAEPIAHISDDEVSSADLEAMRRGAGLLTGTPDPVVRLRIVPNRWGTPLPQMTTAELTAFALPAGEAGEIVVAGPHVVPGYLHGRGDEETKFRVDGEVWHRTGDLGRLDDANRLWLLGRANAVIQDARGVLYPFAVECAAREHLGGMPVAVMQHEGRRLLVLEAGRALGENVQALSVALAWAALDEIVTVRRLPLDKRHNSKIDYPALAKALAGRHIVKDMGRERAQ